VTVSTYNPLIAEEEKWHLAYETDGVDIYKRVAEESKFLEFKATGNLRGTMSEYVSAILDTDEHPDWAPRCLETRNIDKINLILNAWSCRTQLLLLQRGFTSHI
ncbi:MAG: SRPBCC family protein, partial [Planctomycetota bacterium]